VCLVFSNWYESMEEKESMTIMDMQNELYNPNTMKVVVNQYVIFYEAKF